MGGESDLALVPPAAARRSEADGTMNGSLRLQSLDSLRIPSLGASLHAATSEDVVDGQHTIAERRVARPVYLTAHHAGSCHVGEARRR